MLKLRRDLARALSLLELVARREATKRELVRLTGALASARHAARDYNHLLPDPPPKYVYTLYCQQHVKLYITVERDGPDYIHDLRQIKIFMCHG
jgi:hypothetical protein